jgi:hypothetical protein
MVKHLSANKAPGLDGFTGWFYKSCWPIIKTYVMAAISCVWAQIFRNMGTLNSAFILLIPKSEEAQGVKDYTHISLVHSFAKLATKILANWRPAGQLQQMISLNQSALIKKCFIPDNFMLV